MEKKSIVFIVIVSFLLGYFTCLGSQAFLKTKKAKDKDKKADKEAGEEFSSTKYVDLGKYDGLTISLKVTDEDIQNEIDSLLEDNVTYVKENGTVADGDMVFAAYQGYIDGKKIDDICGEDYIQIGGDEWIPGFNDKIVGAKTTAQIKFKLTIPKGTLGDEEIDGKEAEFKLVVEYICGDAIKPEYNDDLVKSATEYSTVKEYEKALKEQIGKENEEQKEEFAWDRVLEKSKVKEYPEKKLKEAKDEVLQGYYDMAEIYNVSHDEVFEMFGSESEEDFKKNNLEELAKDALKERLVAEAIASKEDIEYSVDGYKEALEEEFSYNTEKYDSQEAYEKENKKRVEYMATLAAVKEWVCKHTTFTS